MLENIIFTLTLVAALGSGLIAGAFFTFSSFIMRGLAAIPDEAGIRAMQSINIVVINPVFMSSLMGTAVVSLVLGVAGIVRWEEPGAVYHLTGSVLYLVGTLLVTIVFNVPRNNLLARLQPGAAEAAQLWATYVEEWTRWNTVRTIAALGASAAFIVALVVT